MVKNSSLSTQSPHDVVPSTHIVWLVECVYNPNPKKEHQKIKNNKIIIIIINF